MTTPDEVAALKARIADLEAEVQSARLKLRWYRETTRVEMVKAALPACLTAAFATPMKLQINGEDVSVVDWAAHAAFGAADATVAILEQPPVKP